MVVYVYKQETDVECIENDEGTTLKEKYIVRGVDNAYAALTASGVNEIGANESVPERGEEYPNQTGVAQEDKMKVIEKVVSRQYKRQDELCYVVTVTYNKSRLRPGDPRPGDEKWTWADRDENTHIEMCYSQTAYGEKAPSNSNLIGVREDGKIEGMDALDTTGEFTCMTWLEYDDVVDNLAVWGTLRKHVNNATWKGFPAGTMLFLGYSIDPPLTTLDPTQVTFRFSYRPNQTSSDLPTFQGMGGVGSGGTPSELITITGGKLGHQYIWALQGESSDGTSLSRRVKGVYVSTIYQSADFSLLGLNAGLVVTNAATPSGS